MCAHPGPPFEWYSYSSRLHLEQNGVAASTLSKWVRPRHALLRAGLSTLRGCSLVLLLAQTCQPALAAEPACKIARLAELPVTMVKSVPIVHALVNGTDAAFIADSGSYFNIFTAAAAAEFKLPLKMAPEGYAVSGIGEVAFPTVATVRELTLYGAKFPNIVFLVERHDFGPAVGVLGQSMFHLADAEYDLANGVIRIMRPDECTSVGLAYWATAGKYSQIDITLPTQREPYTTAYAYLNGKKVQVVFDSGTGTSMLSLDAAKRAGVTPTSEGVTPSGTFVSMERHQVQTWIAPFESFKIGDEEIRNIRLRIADAATLHSGADMLIGADFFLSHRIYVANGRHKLYFTYNGGPVFGVGSGSKAAQAQDESIAVASGQSLLTDAEPTDAAAFSRRAAASSARHEYAAAVSDLNQAVELAPAEPSYLSERGIALWSNRQTALALADFDAALKLKPDDGRSLAARATLRMSFDRAAGLADMQAADRYLPKDAPERLQLGYLYTQADLLPASVVQYSHWIDTHDSSAVFMAQTLNNRAWARALMGQDLDAALSDCNTAVKLKPDSPRFLDTRALVFLRLGNNDKAIADYDLALTSDPKSAWSHYGRGIARTRKGLTSEGQADMAEAVKLSPGIAETASRHGISP